MASIEFTHFIDLHNLIIKVRLLEKNITPLYHHDKTLTDFSYKANYSQVSKKQTQLTLLMWPQPLTENRLIFSLGFEYCTVSITFSLH